MTSRGSIAWLIAANLIPVLGVIFLDWNVFAILFLFWCENVVIGVFGIARTALSSSTVRVGGGIFLAGFFSLHYGGFMFGHLTFLIALFGDSAAEPVSSMSTVDRAAAMFDFWTTIAVAALFVSHAWSFVVNFLGNSEYENIGGLGAMAVPYKRMVITHVALIAGGFLLSMWQEPVVGLLVLVGMKIALDVVFHRREHAQLAPINE